MIEKKKTSIGDVDVIEAIADLSGEVEWTDDELRDALRDDGVDPDKLVKNVLSRIKQLNSDLEKADLADQQLAAILGKGWGPVGPLGPRLTEPNKRAARRKTINSIMRALRVFPDEELEALLSELKAMQRK